jgi:hypothetical protein
MRPGKRPRCAAHDKALPLLRLALCHSFSQQVPLSRVAPIATRPLATKLRPSVALSRNKAPPPPVADRNEASGALGTTQDERPQRPLFSAARLAGARLALRVGSSLVFGRRREPSRASPFRSVLVFIAQSSRPALIAVSTRDNTSGHLLLARVSPINQS